MSDLLDVGDKFRGIQQNKLCHVIGICDADDDERIVTYRWWSRTRKQWEYEAKPEWLINDRIIKV